MSYHIIHQAKRMVKRLLPFCLLAFLPLFALLTSCTKDYESPLAGSIPDQTLGAKEGYRDLEISGKELYHCTVASDAAWCIPKLNGTTLRIVVTDNDLYDERSATVTVTDTQENRSVSFKVTQQQKDAIEIDGSVYEISENGGSVTIGVLSNVTYEVQLDGGAWMTLVSPSRGLVPSDVVINVAKNETGDGREGKVTIVDAASGAKRVATIKQDYQKYIYVEEELLTCDENGGELELSVESSINYRIEVYWGRTGQRDWLQVGERQQLEKHKYKHKIVVDALPATLNTRSCDLNLDDGNMGLMKVVSVIQTRK